MSGERVIRALLRLYPAAFRERYGADMLAFQRDRVRSGGGVRMWVRIVVDHITSALSEWIRAARGARVHAPRGTLLTDLLFDLRHARRSLSGRRVLTAVVLATIALGVGANTAIFSVVHAILLRPLPYPDAEQVVTFGHEAPVWLASQPEYLDYRNNLSSFEGLAAYTPREGNLTSDGEPERVALALVSAEFFDVLGVFPMIGRGFAAGEDATARPTVVILSHGLWQRRFGGDRSIVGRTIVVNDLARDVIGIMPPHFDYPSVQTELWLPMQRIDPDNPVDRGNHYLFMVGRLRAGVMPERALTEAREYAKRMTAENISRYDPNHPPIPVITRVGDVLVGSARPYLWLLLGVVGLVMLIACANVANLLLARGEGRRMETALRGALGATRTRLIRQHLAESALLAVVGGVLGVVVAWLASRALVASAPATIPRLGEIHVNGVVLVYALVTSLLAGLLFGAVPAFRATREAPGAALKGSGKGQAQGSSRRVRHGLVVVEIAIGVLLLSGAGMLLRSLSNLQSTDVGFVAHGVLTAKISPPAAGYDDARTIALYSQMLERVRVLPGVVAAGAAGWLPVVGTGGLWGVLAEGQSYETIAEGPLAVPQQVTTGYFAAMGMPVVQGRDFTENDRASGPYVAVVSRSFARMLWPDADPIGKRFRLGGGETYVAVIGVVNDILSRGFADTPEPTMYFLHAQTGTTAYGLPRSMSLVIRTSGAPMSLADPLRSIVHALDAAIPVSSVRTLEHVVGTSVADRRFATALIGAFACLALLLAGIGIYGVVSYSVSERSFEMGVRMALGAERVRVMTLVLSDSVRMAVIGIALGILGVATSARAIRSLLVDVAIIDIPTLLVVSASSVVVVIAATLVPALRAVAVDPTRTLRGG